MQLIQDKYKSARSGKSKILNIHCRECDTIVIEYQKDGIGNLYRLYMDRIMAPDEYIGLQKKAIRDIEPLRCQQCKAIIATPYIYKKEQRNAFRIVQEAMVKRIKKL